MKLLIYSHFFHPSVGGVETIVLSLACGLAGVHDAKGSREFDITLVTQTPAGNDHGGPLPFRVIRRPGFFQLLKLILASDIVHIAGPALTPLVLALLARKPVVVEHHGFQCICPNGQLLIEPQGTPCPGHFMAGRHNKCIRCNSGQGGLASWRVWVLTFARRFLCSQVSANIVPTLWLGSMLQLSHITAVPHGLDAGQAVSRIASSSSTPVIAFMGRLVTTKGVHVLLQAARILQDQNRPFELLIIGDGPERAALEQFVRASQLAACVRFSGRLYGAHLEAELAQAAVVVVPSLGGEVFGLVVAENMLRGLPIVASDLGAFVEVMGGTGLTFRTGDPADLARALSRLLDDSPGAASLAQQARLRALHWCDKSRMIEGHVRVYEDVAVKRA